MDNRHHRRVAGGIGDATDKPPDDGQPEPVAGRQCGQRDGETGDGQINEDGSDPAAKEGPHRTGNPADNDTHPTQSLHQRHRVDAATKVGFDQQRGQGEHRHNR